MVLPSSMTMKFTLDAKRELTSFVCPAGHPWWIATVDSALTLVYPLRKHIMAMCNKYAQEQPE